MFSISVYALITKTISVTSQNRNQIMAARILNYNALLSTLASAD